MDPTPAIRRIRRFFQQRRRMPTYREIARLVGYRSTNAVAKLVNVLVAGGSVVRDTTGHLTLPDPFGTARVLGTVEAGWPSPAEEELADTMSLDEWLISNREATFMLKVRGESMRDAGIMPGDMVLVERGSQARDGDIVVAEVDGAWTMKYLRHRDGKALLMPANPKFRPIVPRDQLNITAVVKAVIRKY
ncbi:MAG TPA: transcriptional repressor LexA [Candidatus Paceibacterota bacterium]|nr:transcriptional repressor LexA [Candidatus Paceibacterota bacterium]